MGKSTGSIAVALVVGAAIGFVAGRASRTPGTAPTKPAEAPTAAKPPEPGAKPPTAPTPPAQYFNVPVDPFQPTKGPADAKITIVEVSDFQ